MIGRTDQGYAGDDQPCRILLVSDQRLASHVIETHLAHHGFTVVGSEATAGAAAATARRERPDVVLIDGSVRGGWHGIVRALDTVAPDRIAVLAAYWSTSSRQEAASAGIGATLLKRVEGADLVRRLRELAGSEPAH